jgi:hypothetical protein
VRAVSLVWPLSASTQRPSGSLMTPVGPSSPEASSRLGAAAPEPTPVIRRSSPWSHWPRRRRSPPPPGRWGQGQRDRVRHERDQLGLHPAWPGAGIRGQGDDRCRRSVERRPRPNSAMYRVRSGPSVIPVGTPWPSRSPSLPAARLRKQAMTLTVPVRSTVQDVVGRSVAYVPAVAAIRYNVVGIARQHPPGLKRLEVDHQTAGAAHWRTRQVGVGLPAVVGRRQIPHEHGPAATGPRLRGEVAQESTCQAGNLMVLS